MCLRCSSKKLDQIGRQSILAGSVSMSAPESQNEMMTQINFIRRDPTVVQPWAETCGEIHCVIEESDGAAGEVHHV